ncbi:hypothetical protein [Alloalcanivorax profundimaris]|uniref:hypothetical protein n=1 Tax=Alloalcanivorax profundimaris TaxID=2735259 RepID=UPI0018891FDD|nr:hypothetical protein [Alloalcanivorax profundimaris]MBF1802399.1 hypothetical protein [Alloalcanivorax profundimaris]
MNRRIIFLLVLFLWAGNVHSRTVNITVGEMSNFLMSKPYGDISQYLWSDYLVSLRDRGVLFADGGVLFYKSFSGGKHHCGSTKHSWYVNARAFIGNGSDFWLMYEALDEPVRVGLNVDGSLRFDGSATFRPSTSILGKCVRYDKVKVNLDMPDLPLNASVYAVININPSIVPKGVSQSGRTEIVIEPSGVLRVNIDSYGDPDIDADIDAHGGVGAVVGAIFGAPIAGFLTEIGLAEVGGDYVADEVEDRIIDYLEDIKNGPMQYDFSSRLGGRQVFLVPELSALSGVQVSSIISSEGFFMLMPNIYSAYRNEDAEALLAHLMVYGRKNETAELRKANGYSAAMYTAVMGY